MLSSFYSSNNVVLLVFMSFLLLAIIPYSSFFIPFFLNKTRTFVSLFLLSPTLAPHICTIFHYIFCIHIIQNTHLKLFKILNIYKTK